MSKKYWFGFKQTRPSPPGNVVECGPYDTYEEAKAAREAAKAWDCSVSLVFTAETAEEALEEAKRFT